MMASPPIETAVDWPRPAAVRVLQISVVMPPERDMTPIGPFLKARRTFTAGPPRPPILASPGGRRPGPFGARMRAARGAAGAPGRHAAADPGAVVEALAPQVHRRAAGDCLNDDRGVLVDQDRHHFI